MLKIRKAKPEDLTLIVDFIKELADFEKLSSEVQLEKSFLEKYLFTTEKKAEVIIAENLENVPVGFALYFFTFSTFLGKPTLYLEDLFVRPKYRGQSYGTSILKFLATEAVKQDCGRMEWSVLDWNKKAIDVYEKIGAKPMSEWTGYRLSAVDLVQFSKNK